MSNFGDFIDYTISSLKSMLSIVRHRYTLTIFTYDIHLSVYHKDIISIDDISHASLKVIDSVTQRTVMIDMINEPFNIKACDEMYFDADDQNDFDMVGNVI